LNVAGALPESQAKERLKNQPRLSGSWQVQNRVTLPIYVVALAVSISTWFIAIRAPLRLDETGSFWQISAGFSQIWPRQFAAISLSFPAYNYILWLSTKLIGTSEIALRIPSVIAMLGAVYLLYLAAREIFEREIAIIAAIIFCLHPIVAFEAIDIRPYAFGVLATNAAILILLRLRRNSSNWLAALFGLTAAWIIWFHYLLGVILPALVLCFIVFKFHDRKTLLRQFSVAFAAFALAIPPVIPGLIDLFHTSRTHVCELPPDLADLARTLLTAYLFFTLCGTAFVAFLVFAAGGRRNTVDRFEGWHLLVCISLAFIPLSILYGVSVGTPIHMFTPRHRLEAVPGIALCWAFVVSRFHSRTIRLLFCVTLVATTAFQCFTSPPDRYRENALKYALDLVERNASVDDAPVVICSGFIESDYSAMPSRETAKSSQFFAPLSYYKLNVPVVPLPQGLNDEAIRDASRFLQEATQKHERFLVVAYRLNSYGALDWFADNAAATHSVHKLGVFEQIEVLEFVPREPRT
jgi:mannosyltransferase